MSSLGFVPAVGGLIFLIAIFMFIAFLYLLKFIDYLKPLYKKWRN